MMIMMIYIKKEICNVEIWNFFGEYLWMIGKLINCEVMIGNVCRKDLKIEINNETGDRNEEKIDGKCRNSM